MRVCFYGNELEYEIFRSHVNEIPRFSGLLTDFVLCPDYDALAGSLRQDRFDLVFISHDNAYGMEGVFAVRNTQPNVPMIWFSNDEDFGSQAYRLHTDFFHSKPITPMILEMALDRALR